jgi:hypothetical protein
METLLIILVVLFVLGGGGWDTLVGAGSGPAGPSVASGNKSSPALLLASILECGATRTHAREDGRVRR